MSKRKASHARREKRQKQWEHCVEAQRVVDLLLHDGHFDDIMLAYYNNPGVFSYKYTKRRLRDVVEGFLADAYRDCRVRVDLPPGVRTTGPKLRMEPR
jgi:hypothetical protein